MIENKNLSPFLCQKIRRKDDKDKKSRLMDRENLILRLRKRLENKTFSRFFIEKKKEKKINEAGND